MTITTFIFNAMSLFVKSDFFASFGYIVMAFGFVICIINLIRRVIDVRTN